MTKDQFDAVFRVPDPDARYQRALRQAMDEFGIYAHLRRETCFLAQIAHETDGLRYMQELGNAAYFAKYDGRADLGNTQPGDGARYHGRGMLQLTGRANYREFGAKLQLPLEAQPDMAAEPFAGARIAGLYWQSRGCNELADADKFRAITKKINGGLNGIEDRHSRWDRARIAYGLAPIREVIT